MIGAMVPNGGHNWVESVNRTPSAIMLSDQMVRRKTHLTIDRYSDSGSGSGSGSSIAFALAELSLSLSLSLSVRACTCTVACMQHVCCAVDQVLVVAEQSVSRQTQSQCDTILSMRLTVSVTQESGAAVTVRVTLTLIGFIQLLLVLLSRLLPHSGRKLSGKKIVA